MMTEREKIIKVIDEWASKAITINKFDGASVYNPHNAAELADAFIENGYRKQGGTVREFLKLLKEKESPKVLMWEYGEGYLDCIKMAEELAAQYGVEVKE